MSGAADRHRLTGQLTVALPPHEAFRLFTARGEREWVAGWAPHFPADAPDDAAPGTVFQTRAHDRDTTWVVVDSRPGRRIRYARVTGSDAGTVTVSLEDTGGHSTVTVDYDLTALTDTGRRHLREFAAHYPDLLTSWQEAIAASTAGMDRTGH